ncbi:MAG: SpoIIE family protein phosphatase [Desulfobacterium sp.]|nr:SpoIIE family protein phosphatase [Desulfobacterium sp.]
MFKAVVGQTEGTDTPRVTQTVIGQCRSQLKGLCPTAGILFAADHFDHALAVGKIAAAFPRLELAGCTSSGEMSSSMGFSQDSMCLMLFASDTISIAGGIGIDLSKAPGKAVRHAVADARSRLDGEPSLCFIFPCVLSGGIETVLSTIHETLGPECKLFGGVAGADQLTVKQISQFSRENVYSDGISVLLFSGDIRVSSVICNSWEPVGYRSMVDAVDGNRVKGIGGRTALQFFREAFGPYAVPLNEMPLAVFDDNGRYYLRSPISYEENDESLGFATPIPEGLKVQLTEATPENIITNVRDRLHRLVEDVGADWSPQVALLFSCVSRRWIMGLRTREELDLALSILPANIPIAGFYTFGEIAPISENKMPKLHNCTLVALLLGEDKSDSDACVSTVRHRVSAGETREEVELLAKKLARARESQTRLEMQKESFTHVLRRMSKDLTQAKHRIEEQNQILKESLTLAQEVQQSLIPDEVPAVDGFEVAGCSLYCDETGGDYIDYLPGKDGLAVVVGDVSGHGIAAALLMTTARALLRMRAGIGGRPRALITDLNRFLTSDVADSGRFMTLIYLRLNSDDRTVTWVRAGHEPALCYAPDTNRFNELRGQGMALGVMDDVTYDEYTSAPLNPGDIIVLTTDGITETRNTKGRLFGRKRLMEIVRKNANQSAASILEACLQGVQDFREGLPREDDETLVVIIAR